MRNAIKLIVCFLPLICLVAFFKDFSDIKSRFLPKSVAPQHAAPASFDIQSAMAQENVVPVIIVGSGPAGLSASLYVARAGMKAFVFAGPMPGGQLTQTTFIENWPGRERILGMTLMGDIQAQAESFGATIIHDMVTEIDFNQWPFQVKTADGRLFKALSVILATGATPRILGVPGEQEHWGKGVTTCAVCDASFFPGKDVVIVGGGDSAAEMVFELAPYARKITVLVRKGEMRAAFSVQEKVHKYANASIEYYKEITHIYGDGQKVVAIDVFDNQTNTTQKRPIDGVFLAIGHDPNNKMFRSGIQLDEHGYLVMNGRTQETMTKGVFAAGEIQDPAYRQAIVAAGEGVKAALDATAFLYEIGYNVEVGEKLEKNFFDNFTDVKKELKDLTTIEELYEHVLNAQGVVVLDFYAPTCPCCMQMLPHIEAVAHKMDGQITVVKANYSTVKKTIYRELAHAHDIIITKIPSMLVFKNGKLLDQNVSVMNKAELYEYFSKWVK